MRCARLIALFCFLALPLCASTTAMFRGRVVEVADQPKADGVIYVMSRNGSVRKVDVVGAEVEYAQDFPARSRKTKPSASLVHGADIRIEAEESSTGTWRARSIEILQVPGTPKPKDDLPIAPRKKSPPTPSFSKRGTT